MKRAESAAMQTVRLSRLICLIALLGLLPALSGCYNYARMKDDEAVETYQAKLPEMPKKTVPTTGGNWIIRESIPDDLVNPLPESSEVIATGAQRYGFYCIHCHGPRGEGDGTVGQSFAPLPANLTSAEVQRQSDGQLFYSISFGFKRHPPLFATATDDERWAVIRYMRALAGRKTEDGGRREKNG